MNHKSLYHFTLCAFLLGTVAGCEQKAGDSGARTTAGPADTETAVEHAIKHLDPKYVCPMHPQIIRDKPGTCPICGMDLVQKEAEATGQKKEKKILYWVAPMDPAYRRDGPGKSPMGMDLVPVYDEGDDSGGVTVSSAVLQTMGVRTAKVVRDRLWRRIDTVGYVGFDENRISHIHVRANGWIEKLLVKSEGERVKKGQLLFEFYSPDLVNAQQEYLQAVRSDNRVLIEASHDRLVALGIAESQISALSKTRKVDQLVRVYASQDGIVSLLKAREGMYITPAMEIMSLADLSSVWVLTEVFEKQVDWVKVGEFADVRLSYLPGKLWEGKVEYVYPSLNPDTRTLKVRLRFDNPGEALKPNMFADVTIYGGAKKDLLIIPRDALIRTGDEDRVILSRGEGRFAARKVTAGIEAGNRVEIISGLSEGDDVVTSGQFLIDSEASLKASLQRMSEPPAQQMKSAGEEMNTSSEPVKAVMADSITGKGVLHAVNAPEHKLNMTHEPIPAIDWPAMTMDFRVAEGVPLDGLKAEDTVQFQLRQDEDGYTITSIQKTK